MDKQVIHVTARDIKRGTRQSKMNPNVGFGSSTPCPVVLACQRIGIYNIPQLLDRYPDKRLPKSLYKWIMAYDAGRPVRPWKGAQHGK